ncbi:hypothetical protein FIBSPDRAFT_905300 [Athelia psychrophila]|uniref:Peptidase S53 domain-containing protein n=1 Tax=Athelia psychrophila TaxID=1759441 RepID=A0A167TLL4_9AGAM|nr:hypothetical protein FIBSPDRAFT_905300 [Fibularhizoctonia sp. CBS 109695]
MSVSAATRPSRQLVYRPCTASRLIPPRSNGLAVAGFIGFWPQKSDLTSYHPGVFDGAAPRPEPQHTVTIDLIDNGTSPQGPGLNASEASLDIQYTVGLASNVPVTFISAGRLNSTDLPGVFFDIAHYLTAMENPPHVLSTSYTLNESLFDAPAARKLCQAYMQLGPQGASVLFGSGDGGVSGVYCTAAALSGGGFSNIFAPAAYQNPTSRHISRHWAQQMPEGTTHPDADSQTAQALFVKTIALHALPRANRMALRDGGVAREHVIRNNAQCQTEDHLTGHLIVWMGEKKGEARAKRSLKKP